MTRFILSLLFVSAFALSWVLGTLAVPQPLALCAIHSKETDRRTPPRIAAIRRSNARFIPRIRIRGPPSSAAAC